jgi:hypothetical protein
LSRQEMGKRTVVNLDELFAEQQKPAYI